MWYLLPTHCLVNGSTYWVRNDGSNAVSFPATYQESTQSFICIYNNLIYPIYSCNSFSPANFGIGSDVIGYSFRLYP